MLKSSFIKRSFLSKGRFLRACFFFWIDIVQSHDKHIDDNDDYTRIVHNIQFNFEINVHTNNNATLPIFAHNIEAIIKLHIDSDWHLKC